MTKRSRSAIGRQNRRKEREHVREVAGWLTEATGRLYEPEQREARSGRWNDVREVIPLDASLPKTRLPLVVECRRGKRPSVLKAIGDALAMKKHQPDALAIAVIHVDGEGPHKPAVDYVAMERSEAKLLLDLYSRWHLIQEVSESPDEGGVE